IAGGRWLVLLDPGSGNILHRLDQGQGRTLVRLRFATDGKTVALASYQYPDDRVALDARHSARAWDTATGKPRGSTSAINYAEIQDLALSPDGSSLILVLSNANLIRWGLADGKSESRQLA